MTSTMATTRPSITAAQSRGPVTVDCTRPILAPLSTSSQDRRLADHVVDADESGGFDVELVDLADAERSRYSCPICLLLLRDPLQTTCGHRFCQRCIHRWCRETPECPTCKSHINLRSDLFPDNCAKREVLDLTSRCPNLKHGCDVTLSLGQLQTHLQVCTAAKQLCEVCGEQISKVEMDRHCTQICPSATVQCHYHSFGCNFKCERRNIGEHLSQCIERHLLLLATYVINHQCCCIIDEQQAGRQSHRRRQEDSRTSLAEPIKLPGHDARDIDANECTVSISQLTRNDTNLPPSYFTEQRLTEIYRTLQDQRGTPSSRSAVKQISSAGTYQAISTVSASTYQGSAKLQASQTGDVLHPSKNQDVLQNMLMEQTRKLAQYESRVSLLESRISELESDSGCREGIFVMKIDSFTARRLPDARTGQVPVIYSQAFYSHPQGYKFCLRVHPNGLGPSDQSTNESGRRYLSLFIHLMRGEFDDILEWPFRGRITLSVLDLRAGVTGPITVGRTPSSSSTRQQQQPPQRKRDITACVQETDPTLEAFQRPAMARSRRGFGYVEFASLADLQIEGGARDVAVESPFLINDTLFIRATVEVAKNTG